MYKTKQQFFFIDKLIRHFKISTQSLIWKANRKTLYV